MRNLVKKTCAIIPLAFLLAGCDGRASANLVFNSNSTLSIEELVLVSSDEESSDSFSSGSSALSPSQTYDYKEKEAKDESIDGKKYTGYYTLTNDLSLSDYEEYLTTNATNDYAFKPTVEISGFGIHKTATISCKNYLSSGSSSVNLDGSSLKVNVTIPATTIDGTVTANTETVDEDGTIYTWENEEIDDMSISFEYMDYSGPISVAVATVFIVITIAIVFGMTDALTKPKDPSKFGYKV